MKLNYCKTCKQMTNHNKKGICLKCKNQIKIENDIPLVPNSYITVVGKIDDIIEFAEAATKP